MEASVQLIRGYREHLKADLIPQWLASGYSDLEQEDVDIERNQDSCRTDQA